MRGGGIGLTGFDWLGTMSDSLDRTGLGACMN